MIRQLSTRDALPQREIPYPLGPFFEQPPDGQKVQGLAFRSAMRPSRSSLWALALRVGTWGRRPGAKVGQRTPPRGAQTICIQSGEPVRTHVGRACAPCAACACTRTHARTRVGGRRAGGRRARARARVLRVRTAFAPRAFDAPGAAVQTLMFYWSCTSMADVVHRRG